MDILIKMLEAETSLDASILLLVRSQEARLRAIVKHLDSHRVPGGGDFMASVLNSADALAEYEGRIVDAVTANTRSKPPLTPGGTIAGG